MKPRIIASGLAVLMLTVSLSSAHAQDEVGVSNSNSAEGSAYGYFTTNIGGSGDHPAPYAPGLITAPVLSPTLFSVQGLPAQVKNFPLLMNNFFSTANHDVALGCSGGTKIIYNSAIVPERPDVKERKIRFDFNGVSDGEVIGSLTIQSRKNKGDEVDIPTLIHDATRYVSQLPELKGYNITLLSMSSTLTYIMGVDTRSTGLTASPYVSGLINGPAGVLAGIVPGASKSGGVTVPTAIIGCTFLVLVDSDKSQRVDIRGNYGRMPIEQAEGASNGNNRKKYEAEQEK